MNRTFGFRQTQILVIVQLWFHGLSWLKIEYDLAQRQLQLGARLSTSCSLCWSTQLHIISQRILTFAQCSF